MYQTHLLDKLLLWGTGWRAGMPGLHVLSQCAWCGTFSPEMSDATPDFSNNDTRQEFLLDPDSLHQGESGYLFGVSGLQAPIARQAMLIGHDSTQWPKPSRLNPACPSHKWGTKRQLGVSFIQWHCWHCALLRRSVYCQRFPKSESMMSQQAEFQGRIHPNDFLTRCPIAQPTKQYTSYIWPVLTSLLVRYLVFLWSQRSLGHWEKAKAGVSQKTLKKQKKHNVLLITVCPLGRCLELSLCSLVDLMKQ